jgi:hypothetical protein
MRLVAVMLIALTLSACATTYSPTYSSALDPPAPTLGRDDAPPLPPPPPRRRSPKMRTAGYVLLGIGGVLAIAAGAVGATANQPGCKDEQCWLPQLAIGTSLGSLGGSLALTGGILALVEALR